MHFYKWTSILIACATMASHSAHAQDMHTMPPLANDDVINISPPDDSVTSVPLQIVRPAYQNIEPNSPQWHNDIMRAQTALNTITTIRANFLQTSYDGGQASGTFALSKPGKFRFDYQVPEGNILVSNGKIITFYDAELKQPQRISLDDTVAYLLVKERIDFTADDITITDITYHGAHMLVSFTKTDAADMGSLTLQFRDHDDLFLTGWRVIDGQGARTDVTLLAPEYGINLPKQTFFYDGPEWSDAYERR